MTSRRKFLQLVGLGTAAVLTNPINTIAQFTDATPNNSECPLEDIVKVDGYLNQPNSYQFAVKEDLVESVRDLKIYINDIIYSSSTWVFDYREPVEIDNIRNYAKNNHISFDESKKMYHKSKIGFGDLMPLLDENPEILRIGNNSIKVELTLEDGTILNYFDNFELRGDIYEGESYKIYYNKNTRIKIPKDAEVQFIKALNTLTNAFPDILDHVDVSDIITSTIGYSTNSFYLNLDQVFTGDDAETKAMIGSYHEFGHLLNINSDNFSEINEAFFNLAKQRTSYHNLDYDNPINRTKLRVIGEEGYKFGLLKWFKDSFYINKSMNDNDPGHPNNPGELFASAFVVKNLFMDEFKSIFYDMATPKEQIAIDTVFDLIPSVK